MSRSDERYRQLAMLTIILAEVVGTPSILGALAFWLLKETPLRNLWVSLAALLGLGIGFYRVYLTSKKYGNHESGKK